MPAGCRPPLWLCDGAFTYHVGGPGSIPHWKPAVRHVDWLNRHMNSFWCLFQTQYSGNLFIGPLDDNNNFGSCLCPKMNNPKMSKWSKWTSPANDWKLHLASRGDGGLSWAALICTWSSEDQSTTAITARISRMLQKVSGSSWYGCSFKTLIIVALLLKWQLHGLEAGYMKVYDHFEPSKLSKFNLCWTWKVRVSLISRVLLEAHIFDIHSQSGPQGLTVTKITDL